MDAGTPDVYRAAIARARGALAHAEDVLAQLDQQGVPPTDAAQADAERRRWLLQSRLETLEEDLARAEVRWAQARAQDAGTHTLKARWAGRRPGWNDNHSLQVWLASGATFAVGAPSRALALSAAQRMAQEHMGVPVHLSISNPRSR